MEEIDLKELINMFLEKKFLIILIVIIFALLGAIYTLKFITPKYESKTSLVLVQTGNENSRTDISNSITTTDLTLNSKLINNYRDIAESKIVASTVISNLNLDMSVEALQKNITVTTTTDTEIMYITVKDTNPKQACIIANEVANVFKDKVNEFYKVNNVNVLDKAEVAKAPSNVHLAKNIIIFAFVGGILVLGYILLINMLDTTIKTDVDIEKAIDVPVLASIVLTGDNIKNKSKRKKVTNSQIIYPDNTQIMYDVNVNNKEENNKDKEETK